MSRRSLDHGTFAGPILEPMVDAFHAAGFEVRYGGAHSNGVTHMAVVPFADGSYLELISTLVSGASSPLWDEAIRSGAGPCAWCLEVTDAEAEAIRVRSLGLPVEGPVAMSRETPEGRTARWSLAFLGDGTPGSRLPFVVEDHSPREIRLPPAAASPLAGLAAVILAVPDLGEAADLFRKVYGWKARAGQAPTESRTLEARVIRLEASPVWLAEPLSRSTEIAGRLQLLGPLPCAFLLAPEATNRSLPASLQAGLEASAEHCAGKRLRWWKPKLLGGPRLALLEVSEQG